MGTRRVAEIELIVTLNDFVEEDRTRVLPASERVRVLLEFLGRSLQMEVSKETLIQPRASAVSSLQ